MARFEQTSSMARTMAVALMMAALAGGGALAQSSPAIAPAAAAPSPQRAVTHHKGVFNGQAVAYAATVSDNFVPDAATGKPGASIITIAYTRDGVKDPGKRPVLFAFNGGPGASSSPLHMKALGPVVRGKAASGKPDYLDNPQSPLDVADLVFIDPVSTGFSRAFPGVDPKQWYNGKADALAAAAVIDQWLKANHREASPRYLVGESYGTTRAALIVQHRPDLTFDGVLLVALVPDVDGVELPYVTSLPSMAAAAWRHERIDRKGRDVASVYNEAVAFARTDYVSALIQGASLPPAERHAVAERMSSLIGLPVDLIESLDLRVEKNDFMFNLLKDKGLRTGLLDTQVTAPLAPGQLGALDDPALGVVPQRPAGAAPAGPAPTPASVGAIPSPAVGAYLRDSLKFASAETYYGVNFAANGAWSHGDAKGAIAAFGVAMKAQPKMRLFWAAGYYDLATPAYAGRYTLDHAGVPGDRLTAAYFAGPHGVYETPENLAAFNGAVRRFVSPAGR